MTLLARLGYSNTNKSTLSKGLRNEDCARFIPYAEGLKRFWPILRHISWNVVNFSYDHVFNRWLGEAEWAKKCRFIGDRVPQRAKSVINEVQARCNPYTEGSSGLRAFSRPPYMLFRSIFWSLKIRTANGESNFQMQFLRKFSNGFF